MPSRTSQRVSLIVAIAALIVVAGATGRWAYGAIASAVDDRSARPVALGPGTAEAALLAVGRQAAADPLTRDQRFGSYQAAVRRAARTFPRLFLSERKAGELGLRITPNAFEITSDPKPVATTRQPFPGLAKSPLVTEFYAASFLLNKAQTFQLVDEPQARFTVNAWLFDTPEGAERGFRAYRELGGMPSRDGDLAPLAAYRGEVSSPLLDLYWVRGPLLLQVGRALPTPDDPAARRAFEDLTTLVDGRAVAAEAASAAPTTDAVVQRLLATRLPDDVLGEDLSPWVEASDVTTDPMRGSTAAASLDVELTQLGQLGSQRQAIRIAGEDMAHLELAVQLYPDPISARRALAAISERLGAQPVVAPGLPAITVGRGGGTTSASDLWWTRGPFVVRASVVSGDPTPTWLEQRDTLARLLDERVRGA